MYSIFQNIDPSPPGECVPPPPPPAFGAGGGHTRWVERVWGVWATGVSIFWKTPDTALYSTYVSTLCANASHKLIIVSRGEKDYATQYFKKYINH
jgi:hypothetical protein